MTLMKLKSAPAPTLSGSHPQLDGLGRVIAVHAADYLLDLHEVKGGFRSLRETDETHSEHQQ